MELGPPCRRVANPESTRRVPSIRIRGTLQQSKPCSLLMARGIVPTDTPCVVCGVYHLRNSSVTFSGGRRVPDMLSRVYAIAADSTGAARDGCPRAGGLGSLVSAARGRVMRGDFCHG